MRRSNVIRVSSKGQIVIPAGLRRMLGMRTGQSLSVRAGAEGEIVLRQLEKEAASVDVLWKRLRSAASTLTRDPLKALHERRRHERETERRERRGD